MTNPIGSESRDPINEAVDQLKDEVFTEAAPFPAPASFPRLIPNSGLYTYSRRPLGPIPVNPPAVPGIPIPERTGMSEFEESAAIPSILPLFLFEELRLDVDGNYPQMKASGQISGFKISPANWIADVKKTAVNTYEGPIWYKNGNLSLIPYTAVKVAISRTSFSPLSAEVTFSGGGTFAKVIIFKYKSRYFHSVNFEFDCAEGVTPVLSYDTVSHPNRPASLQNENLSIATVYRRAGFDVSISGAGDIVPISKANADAKWSDAEMHDAMQIHWSKFKNAPQSALWVFSAALHEMGSSLGGIMFDDVGPNHRQGTALFLDSFIKNAPAGDPAPAAFVNRMIFWTACHEMGHAFNLAHSWQKSLGVQWIPLANEPLARSFMNYPYNVPGGTSSFFSDFEFRFSDAELLFMRHAPYRYVQQGNADWFDHHGFEQAEISPEPKFSLSLEFPPVNNTFEFLEPVVAHLIVRNESGQPQLVNEKLLSSPEHMTIIIKKRGKAARELVSFAQRCWKENQIVLNPGAEMKDSIFLVGRNGWDIAEPGFYTIQASIHVAGEEIVSQPVMVRVAPPKGYEEEYVAQDFFSQDVGRVLNFDGSRYLELANKALWDVVQKLPESKAAIHSRVALAAPLVSDYKKIEIEDETHKLNLARPNYQEASRLLSVLVKDPAKSSSTLGYIDFDYYRGRFEPMLEEIKKAA